MARITPSPLITGISGRLSRNSVECLQTIKSNGTIYTTIRRLKEEKDPTEKQVECRTGFGAISKAVAAWMKTHHDDPLYQKIYKEHKEKHVKGGLLNYFVHLVKIGAVVLPEN